MKKICNSVKKLLVNLVFCIRNKSCNSGMKNRNYLFYDKPVFQNATIKQELGMAGMTVGEVSYLVTHLKPV